MNRMLPNPEQALTIYNLPDGIRAELEAWENKGTPPRDFLGHVLCNNLVMTLTKMSGKEAAHLNEILQFVNMELDANCWGSKATVQAWWKWHKDGKVDPLSVVQMRDGIDTKRQVRALQEALNLSQAVVDEIVKDHLKKEGKPNQNLLNIYQKAAFALAGNYEDSLAIKIG